MATSNDIQYETDKMGNPTFTKINLEKYGKNLEPFLNEIGVLLPKDAFDLEVEKAISSKEFLRKSIEKSNSLSWKT
ncbi:MAG: hypothetical protein H7174_09440 [Flavobacterium sp.]|nr:hypothetical protein [Flavobacterium sp.]